MIKQAQLSLDIHQKNLQKLTPYYDDNGIMRVYGRIDRSKILDYDRMHPMILPGDEKLAEMILENIHKELIHPGYLRVVAEIRKKYWIISAMKLAKRITYKCVTCRRWKKEACEQMMSSLPESRLAIRESPFQHTSVDYIGPIMVKYGHRGVKKGYGVIFTCLTTRAIYIEFATDISTEKFLLAFRRFIGNYGLPLQVRSDNGKNFIGAAREIRNLMLLWKEENDDSTKLKEFCRQYEIKWTFSTPASPHHNGAVESMVKLVKSSLNKIMKERKLTEEEYRTIFTEIIVSINSRPVWPISEGDIDQPPITCQDLLRPSNLNHDPPFLNQEKKPRKRYQYIQGVVNEWWKIWPRNFIPNLQIRNKWYKHRDNLEQGDIVLLIDPHEKRSHWNLAKVIKTYPGADKRVRSVQIKTKSGIYDRPITKLCLLLSKGEYES